MAKSRRAPEEAARRPADDDDDDSPRGKRRRGAEDEDEGDGGPIRPRKKKKSATGPVKIVVRIIGAVLGAVALVIFLYWVYSPVGTDHSMLCYFPKETTQLDGYDVDEVLKNARMSPVHQVLINNYKVFGDKRWNYEGAGVKETDVLRYMHGRASGDPEEEKDLPPQQKRGELTVVRFKKAVDEAKFIESFVGAYRCSEETAKDGRKFYQLSYKRKVPPDWHEEEEPDISFFFPNNKTLVYGTTRRETLESMNRTAGKVVVEGTMRELADKVDGHYFTASGGWFELNGVSNSVAFGIGFTGDEFKDERRTTGIVGTASWFASNGNDFLYASANLYGDMRTAREVRNKLQASYRKAQEEIWQSESGKPNGLVDPFNPPQPKAPQGGMGMGGGMGMMGAPTGPTPEQTKDILEALGEYSKTARVYNRGRLVVVEGRVPHGPPETGVFEKFWMAISQKFTIQSPLGGMGGMGPPPLPGGPGGPPAPGGPPPGPGR